jgi:NAD(P)-dependent dehydrogenase (short-subunit alcohol dehydrogenase family)
MRGLQGKAVVVAGGATGIGAASAHRLAAEGARVVVGDLNREGAEATAQSIRDDGGDARPFEFDIADEASAGELFHFATTEFGGIDGLFNVAADLSAETLGRDTNLLDMPLEVWQRTLAVNLTGYLYTMRHALPALLERGGGAIVNTISGLVLNGDPERPAYGASKGAVVTLTLHVASRWGKEGVRCNAVAPGMVLTDHSLRHFTPEQREAVMARVRSPRLGRAEDLAAMVTLLMSRDGEWINGQVIAVNGGTGLR